MPGMKLKRQPGPPTALSWVHSAVWKVDPRWRPYVGDDSWEDIQKKMNPKKHGKRKKAGKGKAEPKAAGGPPPPSAPAPSTSAEAENVIAAYTGGLDQR